MDKNFLKLESLFVKPFTKEKDDLREQIRLNHQELPAINEYFRNECPNYNYSDIIIGIKYNELSQYFTFVNKSIVDIRTVERIHKESTNIYQSDNFYANEAKKNNRILFNKKYNPRGVINECNKIYGLGSFFTRKELRFDFSTTQIAFLYFGKFFIYFSNYLLLRKIFKIFKFLRI